MKMKASSPIFRKDLVVARQETDSARMTIAGTIFKTVILLSLLTASSLFVWSRFVYQQMDQIRLLLKISIPITFLVGWVTYFRPRWSWVTAPLYALSQGVLVGLLSSMAEAFVPGVVSQAIPLTFCVLFGMLALYVAGVVKVTHKFRSVILVATMAIFLTYLAEWVLAFIWGTSIPYIHQSGALGIAFSTFVVLLAAFTLLVDFEYILQCEKEGVPRYMEWYCAYGLMVTLVWLYLEILKLLIKSSKRSK